MTSPTQLFLDAVFAADASIPFPFYDAEGQALECDGAFEGSLYTTPLTEGGVAFLFGVQEDVEAEAWQSATVPPTAVLYKDRTMILCWALDMFEKPEAALPVAIALGMETLDETIPVPPTAGWDLIHCDINTFTTLAALRAAYATDEAVPEPVEESPFVDEPVTYGDAIVRRSYVETDYLQDITVTLGAKTDSKNWKPETMPLGQFIAHLCQHRVGKKDGPAFVLADMVPGQRLKTTVKALYGIGLDIDTGTPSAVVDAALDKLGCLAVRYTTHSHNKTTSEFKKDKVAKFIADEKLGDVEYDDELIRNFLRKTQQWDESVIKTAVYVDTDYNNNALVVFVRHAPMPKHRIVVPLASPFEIAKEGHSQKEALDKWSKIPKALSDLLNLNFDRSCTDSARLFFLPRHSEKNGFEISLWGGPLFDWRTLQLENPLEKLAADFDKGKSKSQTPEGRELGRWSIKRAAGFQIADVIEAYAPDRIRGSASQGITIECPNSEAHSNFGDTSDTACFAVNAGMGVSEIFTISCRHESCSSLTNLDMLGKMIKDGWFEKEVLNDEQFNAIILDDETGEPTAPSEESIRNAIALLRHDSPLEDIEGVLKLLAKAELNAEQERRLLADVKKNTKALMPYLKQIIAQYRPKRDIPAYSDSGHALYSFNGAPDFPEACKFIRAAIIEVNRKRNVPHFCVLDGVPCIFNPEGEPAEAFRSLDQSSFWAHLNKYVAFQRQTEKGGSIISKVPEDFARLLYCQANDWLPPAPMLSQIPVFLACGEVVTRPGYHFDPARECNVYIQAGIEVEIPQSPTYADAQAALARLRTELLDDFAFCDRKKDGTENRDIGDANALAFLLTPALTHVAGRSPLFLVSKAVAGEGGTLLAQIAALLYDGSDAQIIPFNSSDEELHKSIIAGIRDGRKFLFFDDVESTDSKTLHRNLTSDTISGRLLQTSHTVTRKNRYIWLATGINPVQGAEIARRTVPIRLNSKTVDPTERQFRHPDISGLTLTEFLAKNRASLVGDLVTLVRYWVVRGKPLSTNRMASFETWSQVVGGILECCGVSDFLGHSATKAFNREAAVYAELAQFALATFREDCNFSFQALFDELNALTPTPGVFRGVKEFDRESKLSNIVNKMNGRVFSLKTPGQEKARDMIFKAEYADSGAYALVIREEKR